MGSTKRRTKKVKDTSRATLVCLSPICRCIAHGEYDEDMLVYDCNCEKDEGGDRCAHCVAHLVTVRKFEREAPREWFQNVER